MDPNPDMKQRSTERSNPGPLNPDLVMYSDLRKEVNQIIKKSSFLEMYGYDLLIVAVGACFVPVGFYLLRSDDVLWFLLGLFILGSIHVMFITKAAHSAAHSAFGPWKTWNKFWGLFFVEVVGGFSLSESLDIHIKNHHPHTNIIGLGDSSTWKVPFLGRVSYLFICPHLIPMIAPLFSFSLQYGKWRKMAANLVFIGLGFVGQYYCFRLISELTPIHSIVCIFVVRGMYYCPYIHLNIFQHIGLSFYDPDRRPARIRLMATGALNLSRNVILDLLFGHTLSHCHVEHHLFPTLSDNMCLKIKPIVKDYLITNGLPYQEDSYWNRLVLFFKNYKTLMVDPPPLTSFIGIQ